MMNRLGLARRPYRELTQPRGSGVAACAWLFECALQDSTCRVDRMGAAEQSGRIHSFLDGS